MHALLVDTGCVVGVVAGIVLDPVGQKLADRSRAAEERRRLERAGRRDAALAETAAEPSGGSADEPSPAPAAPAPVPDLHGATDTGPSGPAGSTGTAADEDAPAESVRHLLPQGRSVPRMVAAGIVTAVLCGMAASRLTVHGHEATLLLVLPYWVFLAMAVTVSVTDLTHRLVPRQLLYGALVLMVPLLALVSVHLHDWRPFVDAAAAGLGSFAVFFVIWFFVPRGMGFGDVRLAGVIGVAVGYLGLLEAYVAFLIGFVLGLVFGLVLMAASGSGRKTRIPFAPALCIGAAVAVLWGVPLVNHVFHASG